MEALQGWYDQILAHIHNSGLQNLSEYEEDGKNVFISFTDITRSKQEIKNYSYSDFKHGDDFNYISMDFIYSIAVMELLHPGINDAVRENATYNQTIQDHLYLRYASYGLQSLYAYWDRIGDFLDLFFDTGQKGDVYLSRVLNNFPGKYKSETYHELAQLYTDQVLPVLQERHSTVHTFTLKARYYWGIMEYGSKNMEKVKELQDEKDAYPELFRTQLSHMFHGFALALKLVSELPDKVTALPSA